VAGATTLNAPAAANRAGDAGAAGLGGGPIGSLNVSTFNSQHPLVFGG
jgi:hypothetical protein